MAQVPLHQWAVGDTVTPMRGAMSGAQYMVTALLGIDRDDGPLYGGERWLNDDDVLRNISEVAYRRTAREGDGLPPPLDTVYVVANQVNPGLFGWRVGPGSIVLWNGTTMRIQAFSTTSLGRRQVIFTDGDFDVARSTSTVAVEQWESRFRQSDGTPVRDESPPPPVNVVGGPEPPQPILPPPGLDTAELEALSRIIANDVTGIRNTLNGLPLATANFVGPIVQDGTSTLSDLISGLIPATLSDLVALAPSLAAFLSNPLAAILESGGEFTLDND